MKNYLTEGASVWCMHSMQLIIQVHPKFNKAAVDCSMLPTEWRKIILIWHHSTSKIILIWGVETSSHLGLFLRE
jgi:hypothetical protein